MLLRSFTSGFFSFPSSIFSPFSLFSFLSFCHPLGCRRPAGAELLPLPLAVLTDALFRHSEEDVVVGPPEGVLVGRPRVDLAAATRQKETRTVLNELRRVNCQNNNSNNKMCP